MMNMEIRIPLELGKLEPHVANALLSAFLAYVAPWLTAFVANRKMSDKQRVALAHGIAAFLAILQTIATGGFNVADWAEAFTIILIGSQVFYRNVALKLGVRAFENATSVSNMRDEPGDVPLPTGSTIEAIKTIDEVADNVSTVANQASGVIKTADIVTRILKGKENDDNSNDR